VKKFQVCAVWAANFETPASNSTFFFFFGSMGRNKQ
jgi:hypothetical protein